MPAASLFERTVRVQPAGPGRYRANIEPAWNGPVSPNGGILAATLLSAAQAELGPQAPPARTVAAQYLEAPRAGPAEIAVAVLRPGRRVCMCDVRLFQAERMQVQATVVFSAAREDLISLRRSAPEVPPPDPQRLVPITAMRDAPPVFEQLAIQPTFGGVPFSGGAEAVCGGWTSIRGDDGPVDPVRLCALSDLWFPAIFEVLEDFVGVPTLQLSVNIRRTTPVPWPVLARFCTRHVAEGHIEEQGEIFSQEGELLAESMQLSLVLPASR